MQSVNDGLGYVLKLRTHGYIRLEHYYGPRGSRYWIRTELDINKATVMRSVSWEPWIKHGELIPVMVSKIVTPVTE